MKAYKRIVTVVVAVAFLSAACRTPPPAPVASQKAKQLPTGTLDQILAPIALYPDALLAQMLMSAAEPAKVAELDKFIKDNANLKGTQLQDAAVKAGFDPSFVALILFPQVVSMMASQIAWTTLLGQAFTNDKTMVFDSIQKWRMKAKDVGTLKSSPQQKVETKTTSKGQQVIVIEPANPQIIYVPQYNTEVVYTQPPSQNTTVVHTQAPSNTTVVTTPAQSTNTTVIIHEDDNDADVAVAAGLIGFTAGVAIGAMVSGPYYAPYPHYPYPYYGPRGWYGGAYMYNDAWDDYYDHREDAREDWMDHREDLAEERTDRLENKGEQRTDRQENRAENRPASQDARNDRQQTRQDNRGQTGTQPADRQQNRQENRPQAGTQPADRQQTRQENRPQAGTQPADRQQTDRPQAGTQPADRQQSLQDSRPQAGTQPADRQQARPETRPDGGGQFSQRGSDASVSNLPAQSGDRLGSAEARGYGTGSDRPSASSTPATANRGTSSSGARTDAFSGYSNGSSQRAASTRGQASRSSSTSRSSSGSRSTSRGGGGGGGSRRR